MLPGVNSQIMLRRLRDTMAEAREGQARLDKIVTIIAESLNTDVCSIYLTRADGRYELCATRGLSISAVHQTIMRRGEGLVGRVAEKAKAINTADAPNSKGFSFRPETGEDIYHGFLGVPIQRLGRVMGVLVVQTVESRKFEASDLGALETVAIVLAEMTELGAFSDTDSAAMTGFHAVAKSYDGVTVQEGAAIGHVVLHNPRITVENPVAEDPEAEKTRLAAAYEQLDQELSQLGRGLDLDEETRDIVSVFEGFARDRGFRRRLIKDIDDGLSAEAAIEMEQTRIRSRMNQVADSYIRERMADIDDFSNRLLRILVGVKRLAADELPEDAILVARNVGPAELLEYGRRLRGIVLGEGSVGSHAAIVARAWGVPLLIQCHGINIEARQGDAILIDGENGIAHLRPDDQVAVAFRDKVAMSHKALRAYDALHDLPACTHDGRQIGLLMNAGLTAELPSLGRSGAEGVGLFRTELQFLTQSTLPKRDEISAMYRRVVVAAGDKPVTFRTLDIGSDKVLPFMDQPEEPNPAMGWRAIRLGLDRRNILKMQAQCLFRAANGGPLRIMFPFIAQREEFEQAKRICEQALALHIKFGYAAPSHIEYGAMLETPSLAFAPDSFFQNVDFISVGGNDLKQFFFAADRENERVRRRYDTLNTSYLSFLAMIARRCAQHEVDLSFCGEDAGRPLIAAAIVAMGFNKLSMRPASIGPVKNLLRQIDTQAMRDVIDQAMADGSQSVRGAILGHFHQTGVTRKPKLN